MLLRQGSLAVASQRGFATLTSFHDKTMYADIKCMLTSNVIMCLAQGEVVSNHDELMSNFFAQADALALGKTPVELRSENVRPRPPLSRYCAVVSSVLLAAFHVALQWDRRCCFEGLTYALLSRLDTRPQRVHNRIVRHAGSVPGRAGTLRRWLEQQLASCFVLTRRVCPAPV